MPISTENSIKMLAQAMAKSPAKCKKFLVDAGIYTKGGRLTKPYRDAKPCEPITLVATKKFCSAKKPYKSDGLCLTPHECGLKRGHRGQHQCDKNDCQHRWGK